MAMAMKVLVSPTIVNVKLIVLVVICPSIFGRMVRVLMIVVNVNPRNQDILIQQYLKNKQGGSTASVAIAPDGLG